MADNVKEFKQIAKTKRPGKKCKKKRVLIGMPHGGSCTMETMLCTVALFKHPPDGYHLDFYPRGGLYIHHNRNEICRMAINKEYDYLLFIDTDIFYLKEDVEKLLDVDAPIVGGVYPRRGYPYHPTSWNFAASGLGHFDCDIPREAPFECDGVATGFLLLRKTVLVDLYNHYVNPFAYGQEWDGKDIQLGEDVIFMQRLNELGYRAIARADLQIQHKATEFVGLQKMDDAILEEDKKDSAA